MQPEQLLGLCYDFEAKTQEKEALRARSVPPGKHVRQQTVTTVKKVLPAEPSLVGS